MPIPSSKDADARYWAALNEGHLELPRCGGCGKWQWPALSRCGECGHWGSTWHVVEPAGSVFTWTRTWHPFDGTEAYPTPFVTVVVSLPEAGDIRLMGVLDESDGAIAIGTPVKGFPTAIPFGDRQVKTFQWRRAG